MDNNSVNNKLDKIDERLDKVEQVLIRNTTVMEEHHRRSTLLEIHVNKIEERFLAELGPIKNYKDKISYGFKGIVWVTGICISAVTVLLMLKQLGLF